MVYFLPFLVQGTKKATRKEKKGVNTSMFFLVVLCLK